MPQLDKNEEWNAFEASLTLAAMRKIRILLTQECERLADAGLPPSKAEDLRQDLAREYATAAVARRIARHGGLVELQASIRRAARVFLCRALKGNEQ